jgi:hypothetical protein
MPRTEKGRAIYNRSREWDPTGDGRSPITRRDRRDARFLNSTSKPPAVEDEPRFDRGRFKTGHRLDYVDYRLPDYEKDGRLKFLTSDTNTGAAVPAVCEGASCGDNVSAKSTAKFGTTSYEHLNRRARRPLNLVAAAVPGVPPDLGRFLTAELMKHELFRPKKITRKDGRVVIRHTLFVRRNGRLLRPIRFRVWFGQSYPWRWNEAASSYLDVRIDGKAANSADLTWSQAAAEIADETSGNLSTRQYRHHGRRCPIIFYDKPFLGIFLLWLMAGLDAPLTDFFHIVAEPLNTEKEPRREKKLRADSPSNIYWHRLREGHKAARLVSNNELLSINSPRLDQYYRERYRQAAKAVERPRAITERDRIIAAHWRLAKKKCRIVPQAHRADAIQACMERLTLAYENWDRERGAFTPFAEQAIEWAIQDFMKEQRKQVPVDRSINANDPTDQFDEDDTPTEPERTDVMKFNTLETKPTRRSCVLLPSA